MKKYLRWQGLVSFFAITALIVAFFTIFANQIVKAGIEKGLGWYLGAQVDVEEVDINWSPFIINIDGFAATDPRAPEQNLASFESASAGMDFWQYLFGRVIIEELTIEELKLASPRKTPGEVYRQPQELTHAGDEQSTIPNIQASLPDAKTLLAQLDLKTVQASEALDIAYQEEKILVKEAYEKLPTKERLKTYEDKLKALTKRKVKTLDDVKAIQQEYEALKKEFKQDKAIVDQAKVQLNKSKDRLTDATIELKNAPKEDWERIEKEYQLDKIDAADFAHILFGEHTRKYVETAQSAYELIAPMLGSNTDTTKTTPVPVDPSQGRYIHFDLDNPLPDWLVKKLTVSLADESGLYRIAGSEITAQHWLRDLPSTLLITSENVNQAGQLKADANWYVDKAFSLTTKAQWQLDNVPMPQTQLANSDKLSVAMTQASLSADGMMQTKDKEIDAKSQLLMTKTAFSGQAESSISQSVLDALNKLDPLDLTVTVTGSVDDLDTKISSKLDNILVDMAYDKVDKKLQSFKSDVQGSLNEKMSSALNINEKDANELLELEGLINSSDTSMDKLLNSDVVKQKKKELEKRAKQKLEDKAKKQLEKLFG
ncbi:TIGR03545 family protein [Catenovulum sp. SM1970]|uniref:TIGR03545 family protein n=1 Tax=Marinifaba aquimaris TaxID=2741323 RepID=UPI0015718717|nr:TIGR03545 family protein [Marinifaba aquimaris]NTS78790.1 TIGR03545 family protein [Marinifaba aquimaris]